MDKLQETKDRLFEFERAINKYKNNRDIQVYIKLTHEIRNEIRYIFDLKHSFNTPPKNYWRLKRKVHQLRDRLEFYERNHGNIDERLDIKREAVNLLLNELPATETYEGYCLYRQLNDKLNEVSTYQLGKDLMDKLLKHRPGLLVHKNEYERILKNAELAEAKAIKKYTNYIETKLDLELDEALAVQKDVARAYYSIYRIQELEAPKQKIAKYLNKGTGFVTGIDRTYCSFLSNLTALKRKRVVDVLTDMKVPEDTIEMALNKNLFYATKLEALKDFGNVLKLMKAEEQADIIRENIHKLGEANTGHITSSIKAYFKENELYDLTDDEIRQVVADKFGSNKSFVVTPRRSHWRTNYRTGLKDIPVVAHAMITFKLT